MPSKSKKLSNRLKRQRSPSPLRDETETVTKKIEKQKKSAKKLQKPNTEKAKKSRPVEEYKSEDEIEDMPVESLSNLRGAFDDDDFEGFEQLHESDLDSEILPDEFQEGDEELQDVLMFNNHRK